jgi:membrane dipeptidase
MLTIVYYLKYSSIFSRCLRYPNDLMWAESADDIESAFAAGKVASLVGVESGYAISSNMAVLRTLYTMGARYVVYTRSGLYRTHM